MSSIDIEPKTAAEHYLLTLLATAVTIDFKDFALPGQRTLRGGWLRNLCLMPDKIPFAGLHLRNAVIDDGLDLRDFTRSAPGGFPALSLESCHIDGKIDLSFARIARVSLAGSLFRKLSVREAEIDGPLDISGVRPLQQNDTCWVDARDCLINGELNAAGAFLTLPHRQQRPSKVDVRYALWLRNAVIQGNVHLVDDFEAHGGVSIETAHIRGDVTARGALVTACEDDAFNAQNAQIGGGLLLDRARSNDGQLEGSPFRAHGRVWLLGIRIGTTLQLDGADLDGTHQAIRATWNDPPNEALAGSNMTVGTNLRALEAKLTGQVTLSGSRIGGRVDFSWSTLTFTPRNDYLAFNAPGIFVAGQVKFEQTVVHGGIDLEGATIGGGLICDGAALDHGNPASGVALSMKNATISQDVKFGRSNVKDTEPARVRPFSAKGAVYLIGTSISGGMRFDHACLDNNADLPMNRMTEKPAAFHAIRLKVNNSLLIHDTMINGEMNLTAADIGSDVECLRSIFFRTTCSAIYAKDVRIGGDFRLSEGTCIHGPLNLERADITGKLTWQDVMILAKNRSNQEAAKLDLTHARIGTALEAKTLHLQGSVKIDLGNAEVATLELDWPDGWGVPGENAAWDSDRGRIVLDGLTYSRIRLQQGQSSLAADGRPKDPDAWDREALAAWLKQADFAPQPYRQLARVLRIQGDEDAARFIAVCEWDEREGKLRYIEQTLLAPIRPVWSGFMRLVRKPLRKAYGLFFGYGLKPGRAVITLAIYVLIGAIGVHMAKSQEALVERPLPVATMAFEKSIQSPGSDEHSVNAGAERREIDSTVPLTHQSVPRLLLDTNSSKWADEISCVDAANTYWDAMIYAVDMILPFIPLHEETKCEIAADATGNHIAWRVLRSLYTITGWIVSSVTLLTLSGVLRRSEEARLE